MTNTNSNTSHLAQVQRHPVMSSIPCWLTGMVISGLAQRMMGYIRWRQTKIRKWWYIDPKKEITEVLTATQYGQSMKIMKGGYGSDLTTKVSVLRTPTIQNLNRIKLIHIIPSHSQTMMFEGFARQKIKEKYGSPLMVTVFVFLILTLALLIRLHPLKASRDH